MNKILYIILLLPLTVNAVEIAKIQSDPQSASRQKFVLSNKTFKYQKESNLFDVGKNYKLGTFLSVQEKDAQEFNKKFEEVLGLIKQTDKLLRSKGMSFNELSKSSEHHQEFIMFDEFKILKGSNFYPNLDKLFNELQQKEMKHVSGVELSSDLKQIAYISNGKKIKEEEFNIRFSCEKETLPTVCRVKKEGYLFLSE